VGLVDPPGLLEGELLGLLEGEELDPLAPVPAPPDEGSEYAPGFACMRSYCLIKMCSALPIIAALSCKSKRCDNQFAAYLFDRVRWTPAL
jgi:hypothetical protein